MSKGLSNWSYLIVGIGAALFGSTLFDSLSSPFSAIGTTGLIIVANSILYALDSIVEELQKIRELRFPVDEVDSN